MKLQLSYNFSRKSILRFVLFSLALTPLVIFPWTLFPYVYGKTTFIRLAIAVFWILFSAFLFMKDSDGESGVLKDVRFDFLKSPIFISVVSFFGIMLLSSIFAVVPERAIFGTVERGEGLIHYFFLLLFFAATLMFFRRRDWLTFFKTSLIVGNIIAVDAVINYLNTGQRANGSFIGNPTFVAAYLLFVLFAAFVVISGREKKDFWYYVSYLSIVVGFAGLVAANTRGAFVGLFAGVVATMLFLVLRGKELKPRLLLRGVKVPSWRSIGAGVLLVLVLSSSVFVFTRNSEFWQGVPGLDRLAKISLTDNTVKSRLLSAGISVSSVNPAENGPVRFLFGWGSDNFSIAFNQNYNPDFQNYDILWFDHAHNKLLDVLVMQGMVGLLAYLALWFFVLKAALKKRDSNSMLIGAPIIFFATAYFVQNLFVFDQATTYIPFFVLLGYTVHINREELSRFPALVKDKWLTAIKYSSALMSFLLVVAFILYSVIPFNQMRLMERYIKAGDLLNLYNSMDRISEPFNFAQYEIRFRILRAGAQLTKEPEARPFVEEVVRLEEEAAERDGYEPRYFQALGLLKELMAKYYSEPNLYEEAEYDIRKSVELAPGRQDNTFLLAQTLINQGKFDEVKSVADEMLSYAPETVHGRFEHALTLAPYNWNDGNDYIEMLRKVFVEEFPNLEDGRFTLNEVQAAFIRNSYNTYLNYFYRVRDKEGFLMTLNQALKVEKMLDGVGAMQVKEGLISEPVMSAVENIENGIKLFESNGWDAIAPPGQ